MRAHSVERFVHAKSFRLAYPVVRVDEKRSHQLVLALALFPYRATVRSSLANGPAHLAMLSLARAISSLGPPCFETRAHLLRGRHFASYNRGLSGARVRSSYGLSMTITFWAIALLRTVVRLSLFSFLGWTRSKPSDHLAALAELLSCSPRRARPRPRKTFRPRHVSHEPVSAFTRESR